MSRPTQGESTWGRSAVAERELPERDPPRESPGIQMGIFTTKEDIAAMKRHIDGKTRVYTSEKRYALVPLKTRRRHALVKLKATLLELQGETVYIECDGGSRGHFRVDNLRLSDLRMRSWRCWGESLPMMVWVEGQKGASIRIDTSQLYDVRRQEYSGYTHWLIDCYNGYKTHELDRYKPPGFDSLSITLFGTKNEHPTFIYCPSCWHVERKGVKTCPECEGKVEVVQFIERGAAILYDDGIG